MKNQRVGANLKINIHEQTSPTLQKGEGHNGISNTDV